MRIRLLLLLAAATAFAQDDVPVRRALPADAPVPGEYANPAWMEMVEPQIRRAEPVTPVATPPPVPEPSPIPVAPPVLEDPAPPAEAPTALEEGIRIAPVAPADEAGATLARANNFYARKLHEFAIPEYEKFLVLETAGKKRDEAMFRLAESHRLAGNAAAARAGYENLVTEFQTGEFAAAGAYRLGTILFSERLHEPAGIQFGLAAREAKEPEVRLAAAYFAARSLEALGKDDAAEDNYKAVLETKTGNPYFENAAMALGAIQLRQGKSKAAMATYETLAEAAASPEVSANAYLQAARLAKESGFTPKALGLYEQAAAKAVDNETKTQARLSALRLRFEEKDHEGVLKTAAELENQVQPAARAEVLQILAASLRRTGKDKEAKEAYDRLIAAHPEEATPEILYQRLLCLYALKDPALVDEADRFAQSGADPKQKAAVGLLKAESLFQSGNHSAAAKAYEPLLENTWLEPPQRTAALYKHAWSLAASGDPAGAIAAYTEFLAKHPNDKLASSALLQRGLARQKAKDHEGAIADFDRLLKDYAMGKEVELALLQKALTCGHLKKYPEMAEAFRQLLEKYPKSAAAAQANFWLGWAAYENRDFKEAVRYLSRARELDAANYGERATLRIVLAHYQLENRSAAAREVERHKGAPLPPEVLVWVAEGKIQDREFQGAVAILQPLLENPKSAPPGAWLLLSEANTGLGDYEKASQIADTYLAAVTEPPAQARGHLAKARAEAGLQRFPAARQAVEQALFLQPEGRLNSEARIASGEVYLAEGDYDSAARAFVSVSVLTDDDVIARQSLERAAEAYKQAGNDAEAEKTLKELAERFPGSVKKTDS